MIRLQMTSSLYLQNFLPEASEKFLPRRRDQCVTADKAVVVEIPHNEQMHIALYCVGHQFPGRGSIQIPVCRQEADELLFRH